jgi:PhnB protein
MTTINAYLTFAGNCRQAMTFYYECFGGQLQMHPFEGSPMGEKMPVELRQTIMHSNIVKDGLTIMASDGMNKDELIQGNTITLSLNCDTEVEIDNYFSKLSQGGQITMPLADQFWGAKFGMLTDKFGMKWMLNFDRKKQ